MRVVSGVVGVRGRERGCTTELIIKNRIMPKSYTNLIPIILYTIISGKIINENDLLYLKATSVYNIIIY